MANKQAAAKYSMQSENADSERENLIKKIKEIEQQEQKESQKKGENMIHPNVRKVHFDFMDISGTSARKAFSEDTVLEAVCPDEATGISSDQAAEITPPAQLILDDNDDPPIEEKVLLSLGREHPAEEAVSLQTDTSLEVKVPEANEPEANIAAEHNQIYAAGKKGKKKNVYGADPLFAPMLKRAEDISLLDFLADDTEEELAFSIGNDLYINRAASIRLLVKAGHASLHMNQKEAGRLWETVCFYSIDTGYTIMAFWNLINIVCKSLTGAVQEAESVKAKVILNIIIRKEQKLKQLADKCLNNNRGKGE